jgi:predicted enzyme involved in methoxymalonyl-ACP biosynthesis
VKFHRESKQAGFIKWTRRNTDPEVAAAENDPNVFTLQVRLADILGDNGMISVVICRLARREFGKVTLG